MTGRAASAESDLVAVRNVHRLGRNLIHALSVCFKNASLYDSGNVIVQDSARELIQLVRGIHGMEGRVNLDLILDYAALNEVHIRPPMDGHAMFRSLIDGLKAMGIGALQIHEDLTAKEVTDFSDLFNSADPDDDAPFLRVKEGIESYEIGSIKVIETRQLNQDRAEENLERDLKNKSVKHFFQAIRSSRRILEAGNSKKVDFRRARRTVQNLVDTVAEDDFFLLALTSIKNHDDYTFNHSSNVAVYSIALGQRLGLSRQNLADVGMGGLLHDIGKTLVPREILNKQGRLEPDEWEKMKDHSVHGAEILLRGSQVTDSVIRYVLVAFEHHLTLELDGYPELTDRRDLSLFSKIVAIADCFDALTTPRPHRHARYTPHEALGIMMEGRGTLFEPVLLKMFVNAIGVHPVGTVVETDAGELGVVLRTNSSPKDLDKPVIRVFRNVNGDDLPGRVVDLSERDEEGNLVHTIVSTGTPSEYFESIDEYIDIL